MEPDLGRLNVLLKALREPLCNWVPPSKVVESRKPYVLVLYAYQRIQSLILNAVRENKATQQWSLARSQLTPKGL